MFFPLIGLTPEENDKIFKNYNEMLKNHKEKEEQKKKRKEIYDMMKKNPPTTFSGIMGYGVMLSQIK
jgi:hypothetical protein